jgi:hypothetical protein
VHALALRVELHLPDVRSLKAKRSIIKPIVEGARGRYRVASAETGHQNTWQRAELGFAAVGSSPHHVTEVIDEVERFVWSFPEAQVIASSRAWLEYDDA